MISYWERTGYVMGKEELVPLQMYLKIMWMLAATDLLLLSLKL